MSSASSELGSSELLCHPEAGVPGGLDATGLLSNLVAGVEARFDGVPAPLFYVQAGPVNLQVPYTIAGAATTHLEMFYQGKTMGTADLPVAAAAPALLSAITKQDGSVNSETAPAPPGTVITVYATGEGLTDIGNVSGKPAEPPPAHPRLPVTVTIAGIAAEVTFAGCAPGLVGMLQIILRAPGGFRRPFALHRRRRRIAYSDLAQLDRARYPETECRPSP